MARSSDCKINCIRLKRYKFLGAERPGGERNAGIRCNSTYPTPKTGDRSVRSQRGASMTDAELRIIEFLISTSDATRPADLPDWLLALLEGDGQEEMSHELITAASLLYARRLRPGIGFDAARALIAEYAADPARLEDLCGRITTFRLSCCFERLKRSGRFEDVFIDDP